MSAIEVEGLVKRYGNRNIVNDLSFGVEIGEVFGFLGKNGAGKSTTMNMLTGIVLPNRGTIKILGTSIKHLDRIKHLIGVLPDVSNYYNNLTGYQNIKYLAKLQRVYSNKSKLMGLFDKVGLASHENKRVGKYSLGMKKRLGIVQALVANPEILFLDEPTANLDAESAIEIHRLIRSLQNEGKTIFLTSHNLHEIEKLCTRIAIMENGKITKMGTMNQLRTDNSQNQTLYIKTSYFPIEVKKMYLDKVNRMGIDGEIVEGGFIFNHQEEKNIPPIVRMAIQEDFEVYRVEVNEASLEEIFLQA